jgi:hypothetical protein
MVRKILAATLLFVMIVAGRLFGDEKLSLAGSNLLLENELALARKPSSYLVLDFGAKTISLKARGTVLKKWDIEKIKYWGRPVGIKSLKLIKKSAWSIPKRTNITPGKTNDKKGTDLGILEINDMPSNYSFVFEDKLRLSIRPRTKRFFPFLHNLINSISWYTYLPIKTLWFSVRKKSFVEIQCVLAGEQAAKALYWAVQEGISCIFYRPREK